MQQNFFSEEIAFLCVPSVLCNCGTGLTEKIYGHEMYIFYNFAILSISSFILTDTAFEKPHCGFYIGCSVKDLD